MTYREAATPIEWFICSVCYHSIARAVDIPCRRCGNTRVPLDDKDVQLALRAHANGKLISRAEFENAPLLAPLVSLLMKWTHLKSASSTLWRRRMDAGKDVHGDADVRTADSSNPQGAGQPRNFFFPDCVPLEDPQTLAVAELLRWLKVVEE